MACLVNPDRLGHRSRRRGLEDDLAVVFVDRVGPRLEPNRRDRGVVPPGRDQQDRRVGPRDIGVGSDLLIVGAIVEEQLRRPALVDPDVAVELRFHAGRWDPTPRDVAVAHVHYKDSIDSCPARIRVGVELGRPCGDLEIHPLIIGDRSRVDPGLIGRSVSLDDEVSVIGPGHLESDVGGPHRPGEDRLGRRCVDC